MTEPMENRTIELARQQFDLWNGSGGEAWVEQQRLMDQVLAPFLPPLAAAIDDAGAKRALDVGCGAGASTLAAAEQLGSAGDALGVDISAPLIEAARSRAAQTGSQARFACVNIEDAPLEEAPFDIAISRFGVMFFAEPVKAFAHLRVALKPGGRLCAMAWRSPKETPFMTVAKRAAEPDIALPRPAPQDPGQFSFADPERVTSILSESGWRDASLDPIDVDCAFPAQDLDCFISKIGPVAKPLSELPAERREHVYARIKSAFAPFVQGETVRFAAACWRISARS